MRPTFQSFGAVSVCIMVSRISIRSLGVSTSSAFWISAWTWSFFGHSSSYKVWWIVLLPGLSVRTSLSMLTMFACQLGLSCPSVHVFFTSLSCVVYFSFCWYFSRTDLFVSILFFVLRLCSINSVVFVSCHLFLLFLIQLKYFLSCFYQWGVELFTVEFLFAF